VVLPSRSGLSSRRLPGQAERTPLGVPADRPVLPWVDDASPEGLDPLHRLGDIDHGEVGQRIGIARATSALVDANRRRPRVALPALALRRLAIIQLKAEELRPEVSGPLGIIGGKLDQGQHWAWHCPQTSDAPR